MKPKISSAETSNPNKSDATVFTAGTAVDGDCYRAHTCIVNALDDSKAQRRKQLTKLSKDELIERVLEVEPIIGAMDELVLYYVTKINQPVRVQTRFSRGYFGYLSSVRFSVSEVEVITETKEWDNAKGKNYVELKTVRLPISNIVQFEVIDSREEELELDAVADDAFADLGGLVAR